MESRMDRDEVRLIQEWLCLHGQGVVVDGILGPATKAALRRFQQGTGLPVTGQPGQAVMKELLKPLTTVLTRVRPDGMSLSELVVVYANLHLAEHPREVGGENRGPWVRLYMDGHEGRQWPWCAGFATYIVRQACETLQVPMPVARTFSCDFLGRQAKEAGRLVSPEDVLKKRKIVGPGYLFLVRQKKNDWGHVGIVTHTHELVFSSREGNTNDDGSHEGYEVCARTRAITGKDFVAI
jgi:hypothetical protein